MITFEQISIANFMSFGQKPVVVNLNTKSTRAILGSNEDIGEKGSSANGAGKTTIFNAIIFALFGEGIDKLKTDEYINIANGKKLNVELDFEKAGVKYRVRRCRKPNSLDFSVFEDGEYKSSTLDAMRNTDDLIAETVGFTYDIFMSAFFLSPHRKSFMSMTGPEQRSMIEGMLSLDTLAVRAEALKLKRTNEVLVELKITERDLERASDNNARIDARIARLSVQESDFETSKKQSIRDVEAKLEEFDGVDFDSLRAEFAQMQLTNEEIITTEKELSAAHNRGRDLQTQLNEFSKNVTRLEQNRLSLNEFVLKQEEKLTVSRDVVKNSGTTSVELENLIAEMTSEREAAIALRNENQAVESELRSLNETKTRLVSDLESVSDEIKAHENGVCHVCGGDYSDVDKLSELENKKTTLNRKLDENAVDLEQSTEKRRILNTTFPSKEYSKEEIAEKRNEYNQLVAAESIISQSESLENPYVALVADLEKVVASVDKESLEEEIRQCLEAVSSKREKIDSLSATLLVYKDLFGSIRVSKESHIDQLEAELKESSAKLAELQSSFNPFTDELLQANTEYSDVEALNALANTLRKKETHIGYLIKLLTDSKSFIRRRILDQYIPFLNKKINSYAEHLGLPHTCEINTDLSTDLNYMSKSVSYYNLSRGERLRLDMATTRAFRDMMGMLGKGCNIAILDEVLDSALDASGIHAALKFVCDSADTVLLITHREELSSTVDDKILVVKRNGFSDVIQ